jgi:hypothetical protein
VPFRARGKTHLRIEAAAICPRQRSASLGSPPHIDFCCELGYAADRPRNSGRHCRKGSVGRIEPAQAVQDIERRSERGLSLGASAGETPIGFCEGLKGEKSGLQALLALRVGRRTLGERILARSHSP